VWKKRFRAFGSIIHGWASAMLKDDTATPHHQLDLYSTLILALPEDDLSIIKNVSETDKSCGFQAWTTLVVDYYDYDGIYRLAELLQDIKEPQENGESNLQYINRLVRLQRQRVGVGEDVYDRRAIMCMVKDLRKEYHSITDTWDVHILYMDAVNIDLR
jgi:hypothetical protein